MWRSRTSAAVRSSHSLFPRPSSAAASHHPHFLALTAAGATTNCPVHSTPHPLLLSYRLFHSSPSPLVKAGGRSRRAEAPPKAATKVDPAELAAAQRLGELRAKAEEEVRLEEEAQQVAQEGGNYRRPHVKRRGRAVESARRELAMAELKLQQRQEEEEEAALLSPEERKLLEKMVQGDLESLTGVSSRGSGADPTLTDDADAEASFATEENNSRNPAQLVAHVESQLRQVSPSSSRHAFGGIGFDSIDLSSREIADDEVFDNVRITGSMRKLMSDPNKKQLVQRIERVTEKTKEIIGRILLEESIKIANTQAVSAAAAAASSASSSPAAASKKKTSNLDKLIDLRETPTFRIHQIRYSSDLQWANALWTLPRDGYDVTNLERDMQRQEENRANRALGRKVHKYAKGKNESEDSIPNWLETQERIKYTLDHLIKSIRFQLGKELNLKYTPSLKFSYDHVHDQAILKEKMKVEKEQAELKQMLQQELATAQGEAGTNSNNANIAQQKALLTRIAQSTHRSSSESQQLFDNFNQATDFMNPTEMQKDFDFDRQFDENKTYFLPKRKIAALVEREKLKQQRRFQKEKEKELLRQARALAQGVKTTEPLEPLAAPEDATPDQMRAYLKQSIARVIMKPGAKKAENIKKLKEDRQALGQLQQIQSIERKARFDPILDARKKRQRLELPHYEDDWKQKKDKYWRKNNARDKK